MHALLHIDSASHQYILMHVLEHKVEDKPLETQNKEVKCRHVFADLMVPVQAFSQTSCRSNYLFIVPMHAELSMMLFNSARQVLHVVKRSVRLK